MKIINTLIVMLLISLTTFGQSYEIGDKVSDFTLKNIDDKMVSLSDFSKEKGVIIIFTCNHCPYSVAYEDRIIAIDNKFKSFGYPVVAINPNDPTAYPEDSFDNMKIRAKDKGFGFPYLFDADQSIFPKFGATKTPHVFVLQNNKGKFTVEYIGAIDNSAKDETKVTKTYLSDAVNDLLEGEKPAVNSTKAIGCSIKVKNN